MILIYGSENCIWCLKAKQLCETFELDHEYKSIEIYHAEFSSKFPTAQTVPQIMWDNTHMSDYDIFAKAVNDYINEGENR